MRVKAVISYDGSHYQGFQKQTTTKMTITGAIEEALASVQINSPIVGSGRTDAGVHARGQVAHFDTPVTIDVYRLKASLNGLLPDNIGILALEETNENFHARYDAIQRLYHYYISTEKHPLTLHQRAFIRPRPDFEVMNDAAKKLLGKHNFSAFCRTKSETKNLFN